MSINFEPIFENCLLAINKYNVPIQKGYTRWKENQVTVWKNYNDNVLKEKKNIYNCYLQIQFQRRRKNYIQKHNIPTQGYNKIVVVELLRWICTYVHLSDFIVIWPLFCSRLILILYSIDYVLLYLVSLKLPLAIGALLLRLNPASLSLPTVVYYSCFVTYPNSNQKKTRCEEVSKNCLFKVSNHKKKM